MRQHIWNIAASTVGGLALALTFNAQTKAQDQEEPYVEQEQPRDSEGARGQSSAEPGSEADAPEARYAQAQMQGDQYPQGRGRGYPYPAQPQPYPYPQQQVPQPEAQRPRYPFPHHLFLEANGGIGLQIGPTEYLPGSGGRPGDYRFPWVGGPSVGGTVGFMLGDYVSLVASYDYTYARTISAGVPNVVHVKGSVSYHTALLGLRLYVPLGFGRLKAEFSGGVVMPFSTRLAYNYGAALAALPNPITGLGTMINNYSVGYGGQGVIGYELPITENVYIGFNVRLRVFQTENSGDSTRLNNFVTNFEAKPPTATTTTIHYGDGRVRPSTYSLASARFLLSLGVGF